jgi:hypothetical protein
MRVFISYKRGVSPDEPLAMALYEQLQGRHEVFIDQAMAVGTPWAERIDRELRQADVLLISLAQPSCLDRRATPKLEPAGHP